MIIKNVHPYLSYLFGGFTTLNRCIKGFQEYINTGSKNNWDEYIIFRHFSFDFAIMYDYNLAPKKEMDGHS